MSGEQGVDRRSFLRAAALTAIGATVAGGGTAVFLKGSQKSQPIITALPSANPAIISTPLGIESNVVPPGGLPAVKIAANNDDLLTQLMQSQADTVRLQAQLDAANQELATVRQLNGSSQSERDVLSADLEAARGQVGILAGLVALYDQLDEIDPAEVVENGLDIVGNAIGELFEGTPDLTTALENGELALAEVENHIPLLDNGRQWLDAQSTKVQTFYAEVESHIQAAVERVGDLFEMIGDWFEGLRRWLPFGVGEKASGIVSALANLVAEVPHTINGLDTNLAQPLDVWLAREDGETGLQRRLVRPMREEVIAQGHTAVSQTHNVNTVYHEQLSGPARSALSNRQLVRDTIASYRQEHQV